jgi:hypothetical protein
VHAWNARAGFLYDRELGSAPTLGAALNPNALRLTPTLGFGVSLDAAPFLSAISERIGEDEISASTLQTSIAFPFAWRGVSWSAAIGPRAQLRWQRAAAPTLGHQRPAYRALPGLGGFAELGWSPSSLWSISMGVASGAQLAHAASRFVLQRLDMQRDVVLVPDRWFAQAQVTLALGL